MTDLNKIAELTGVCAMGKKRCKTSLALISAAEFRGQALELRKQGFTYVGISEELRKKGINRAPSSIEKAIKKAILEITKESAEEVKVLELERLDMLFVKAMEQVEEGSLAAITVALKIMDRRAKYMGLDLVPTREESDPDEIRLLMAGFSQFLPPPPGSCGHGVTPSEDDLES